PILCNSLATIALIEYFWDLENKENINNVIDIQVENISDHLLLRLDNFKVAKDITFKELKVQIVSQMLEKYLSEIDIDYLVKVAIINQNGSIIASNFRKSKAKSALDDQAILTYLQPRFSNFSHLNQPKALSFKIRQQDFLGQVTPWPNQELDSNWLMLVVIPKSELGISSTAEHHDLLSKHFLYILPIILLGLLTYVWIILVINNLNQLGENKPVLSQEIVPEHEGESKQSLELLNNHNDLAINKDEAINYDAYVLLADMSHELRSPLNAILGFAQIMEQELSTTSASLENNIAIINRNGERLLSIINDVVDLAKIETNRLTLEKTHIDFHAWLDNLEQSFKFQAHNQGWEFSLIRQQDLPKYLYIDERRLRQILRNLIDYCLKSTTLTTDVSLKVMSSSAAMMTVGVSQHNSDQKHKVGFQVENANISVTATELATLFDPMVRIKQEQKASEGSSLNLPISYKLAQLMGGDITVEDSKSSESGVIFNLEIQAESIVAQKLPVQSTLRRIIGLESDQIEYRILIVDDSKTNRKIMSHLLEPVGFKVKEAVNGQEAIDVWLRWQPHMIWMDLRMPVMNGCEATEQIKSYSQALYTPIVALSASTLEEEKSQFKAAGCDDFVGKPFSENIIFEKIAQHLGIRYKYESIIPSSSNNFKLTADTLDVMSDQWLNQVEQAAIVLDQDLLTQLLQTIPSEHNDLKHSLQKQVNNFDFDKILSLVRNSKNN
ncbi:MAG: response regulator, partial [Cyanobacteria bacterium P01_E01_bin.35]